MRSYNFITCENELRQFYTTVLAPLKEGEVLTLFLSARKKYLPDCDIDIKGKFIQRRIVVDYESFLPTVKQFNCQYGSYLDKNGKEIPQGAFVVYCSVNPRSTLKAMKNLSTIYSDYFFELLQTNQSQETIGKIWFSKHRKRNSTP